SRRAAPDRLRRSARGAGASARAVAGDAVERTRAAPDPGAPGRPSHRLVGDGTGGVASFLPARTGAATAMSVTSHYPGLDATFALPPKPLHLAVGMFDGVHLGHRAVIEAAVHSARRTGGIAAALTFHTHPSRVLRPEQPVRLIQSPEMKAQRLLDCGIDAVITETFTRELAAIEATALLPHLRSRLPHLTAIYVGEN